MRLLDFRGSVRKLILAAAALAAGAASAACCGHGYQSGGVMGLGVAGDGTIVADNPASVSEDGGLTWGSASMDDLSRADWSGGGAGTNASVETPRGTYFIEGAIVYLESGGETREAYSAAHLSQSANRWAQAMDLPSCETRLTTRPQDITYDDASGNVVVAMGLMGVAVGLPGGEWREVALGGNYPRDFSFAGKMGMLTKNGFWLGALAAAFAVGGVAVAIYALRGERAGRAALIGAGYVFALPASLAVAWFAYMALLLIGTGVFGLWESVFSVAIIPILFAFVAAGPPLFAMTRAKASPFRRGIALGCVVACAVLGAAALLPYSVRDPVGDRASAYAVIAWNFGAFGAASGAGGLALAALARRRLMVVVSAIALSYALLAAAFALWIANAIPPAVLFLLSPIAVAAAAGALPSARGLGTARRMIPLAPPPRPHYNCRKIGDDSAKSEGGAK